MKFGKISFLLMLISGSALAQDINPKIIEGLNEIYQKRNLTRNQAHEFCNLTGVESAITAALGSSSPANEKIVWDNAEGLLLLTLDYCLADPENKIKLQQLRDENSLEKTPTDDIEKLQKSVPESEIDPNEAKCENGESRACVARGYKFWYQDNPTDAEKCFSKACDLKDADGCLQLAKILDKPSSQNLSNDFLEKACQFGSRDACISLAFKQNRSNCESGDATACLSLAFKLKEQNSPYEAEDYFRKACDLQNPDGCEQVATMINDPSSKDQFLEKACDYGGSSACISIAYKATDQRRNVYFEKACEFKDFRACLARGLINELGIDQSNTNSFTMAAEYYERSCDLESGYGCLLLGRLYQKGKGVSQSDEQAKMYFQKSCSYGFDYACRIK